MNFLESHEIRHHSVEEFGFDIECFHLVGAGDKTDIEIGQKSLGLWCENEHAEALNNKRMCDSGLVWPAGLFWDQITPVFLAVELWH